MNDNNNNNSFLFFIRLSTPDPEHQSVRMLNPAVRPGVPISCRREAAARAPRQQNRETYTTNPQAPHPTSECCRGCLTAVLLGRVTRNPSTFNETNDGWSTLSSDLGCGVSYRLHGRYDRSTTLGTCPRTNAVTFSTTFQLSAFDKCPLHSVVACMCVMDAPLSLPA